MASLFLLFLSPQKQIVWDIFAPSRDRVRCTCAGGLLAASTEKQCWTRCHDRHGATFHVYNVGRAARSTHSQVRDRAVGTLRRRGCFAHALIVACILQRRLASRC